MARRQTRARHQPGQSPAALTPDRPLRVPPAAQIRRIFEQHHELHPALRQFRTTVASIVESDFTADLLTVTVAEIAGLKPQHKIKRLDQLMSEVNIPPDVARAMQETVEQVTAPPECVAAAERILPPLTNLAGALLETGPPFPTFRFEGPMSPQQQAAYRESLNSLQVVREEFLHSLSYAFICIAAAPAAQRGENLRIIIQRIIDGIKQFDLAASICGVTLHNPQTWRWSQNNRMQLVKVLGECRARDTVMQRMNDDGQNASPARRVVAIIDDAVIAYCERTMKADTADLTPLAYWRQVLGNSPPTPC